MPIGVSMPPCAFAICFVSSDVCTSFSMRAFSRSESGIGVKKRSFRFSAARCFLCLGLGLGLRLGLGLGLGLGFGLGFGLG